MRILVEARIRDASITPLGRRNDAVVLTPAVAAAVRAAKVERPTALPFHLRLYRQCGLLRAADLKSGQPGHLRQPCAAVDAVAAALRLPPLLAILATYLVLRWTQRNTVAQGISQEKLAADAGVDRAYLGGLERQEQNPRIDLLDRVAAALSVPISDLFTKPARGERPPKPLKAGRRVGGSSRTY